MCKPGRLDAAKPLHLTLFPKMLPSKSIWREVETQSCVFRWSLLCPLNKGCCCLCTDLWMSFRVVFRVCNSWPQQNLKEAKSDFIASFRFSKGPTTAQLKHSQSAAPFGSHQVGPKWQCHYEFLAGYSAATLAAVQQWAAAPSAAPCHLPGHFPVQHRPLWLRRASQLLRGGNEKGSGEISLGTW